MLMLRVTVTVTATLSSIRSVSAATALPAALPTARPEKYLNSADQQLADTEEIQAQPPTCAFKHNRPHVRGINPGNPMSKLTTHVLDTMNGCPASGMAVEFFRIDAGNAALIKTITLNVDGRTDTPLLDAGSFHPGTYRLLFKVATYFRSRGVNLPEPPFIDRVPLDFGLSNSGQNYHVPLLVSPWAYSTYRGS